MGNIYVARQPIFDSKMKLYGYELFYRRSERNLFEGADDDMATASLLANSFFMGFDELTSGTLGFINFSQNMILSDAPHLLSPEQLVIEVVERAEITPELVEACTQLKSAGYTLAIDNFTDDPAQQALLGIADIVKVDFSATPLPDQALMIRKYKNVRFAAIKVETAEEFRQACSLGYSLFQGYFFNRPVMIGAKEIGTLNSSLLEIIQLLGTPDPDYSELASIIERDVELSYKLLRITNSAISSIQHALVQIGLMELKRWVHLLLVKGLKSAENAELIRLSLIRGKMMALLADAAGNRRGEPEHFITGLFSSIDDLLDEPMDKVLARLPLTDTVKGALLGEPGPMRVALDAVLAFEHADWDTVDAYIELTGMDEDALTPIYLDALRWQMTLENQSHSRDTSEALV